MLLCTTCNRPADDGYVNFDAGERCIDPVHGDELRWETDPEIGRHVRYSDVVLWGDDDERRAGFGGGIYLGVALDEEDGVPYYYFADGDINGGRQTSHGFPAAPGTPTTTVLTPTALIGKYAQEARV